MKRLVLKTFLALSTSASVTLKHSLILFNAHPKIKTCLAHRRGGGVKTSPLVLEIVEEVINAKLVQNHVDTPAKHDTDQYYGIIVEPLIMDCLIRTLQEKDNLPNKGHTSGPLSYSSTS